VNPDVDDRVIKPNEARMAVNFRFGASTEDTNLSGGTLVLGNTELSFTPPVGINKVVGTYSDLESRNVYFAMFNSNGDHGMYSIDGTTDVISRIVYGPWLKFQSGDEYNVSIVAVRGLLYWTDNVNPPRMVNIEKGIRTQQQPPSVSPDLYPGAVEDWQYTQVKRPPGQALIVNPQLGPEDVSQTFKNISITETGQQYSYYYVYDNNEESRLAPYSLNTYANYNIELLIPNEEYFSYTVQNSLIKAIVYVVRNGNNGVWRELRYVKNTTPVQVQTVRNVLTDIKGAIGSDITDARYDSVPLQSATNEVAQNRLNHANYVVDYDYDTSVQISASIKSINDASQSPRWTSGDLGVVENFSFLPWGRYTIGVELVDKYGRTQPISGYVDVTAPYMDEEYTALNSVSYLGPRAVPLNPTNQYSQVGINIYDQGGGVQRYNNLVCEYSISLNKPLPDWVDRVNIVRSTSKNITTMVQSLGYIYLWYKDQEGANIFFYMVQQQLVPYQAGANSIYLNRNEIFDGGSVDVKYTFQGYAIKANPSTPITKKDNQYITIYPTYNALFATQYNQASQQKPNDVYYNSEKLKYKVSDVIGDLILVSKDDQIIKHPSVDVTLLNTEISLTPYSYPVCVYDNSVGGRVDAENPAKYVPLNYNFTVTEETNVDEQVVYVTDKSYSRADFLNIISTNLDVVGFLKGDAYMCRARKEYRSIYSTIYLYVYGQYSGNSGQQRIVIKKDQTVRYNALLWYGTFISMSPRDIWRPEWNQDIGQVNTTNYLDSKDLRQSNQICFSNPTIGSTQVNGLNKFNSLDFRSAPAENGAITSLVTTNATQREPGVLLAIGTYGVSSFYYDAIQLTNVDGTNNVTTTDSYLASQRPLLGQYGTTRPMSVTKTPLGTVYWWSDVVNDLIRYTNAGLERLGNTFSFANFLRRTYNDNPLLITWYDQVTDEINLLGKFQSTSVFSERYKTFQGVRSYWAIGPSGPIYPERAIGLPTKQYWFVNGKVFMADVKASKVDVPDNFLFGSFRNPQVSLVTNESPAAVKRWNQIKVFGNKPTQVSLIAPIDDGGELRSSVSPDYFISRKGDWEAAIRRASNTTGGLLAGKLMESRIIYSNFAFSAEGFDKLNFIEVKSNVSIVQ
jgi:hypothetical protein